MGEGNFCFKLKKSFQVPFFKFYFILLILFILNFIFKFALKDLFWIFEAILVFFFILLYFKSEIFNGAWKKKKFSDKVYSMYSLIILFSVFSFIVFFIFSEKEKNFAYASLIFLIILSLNGVWFIFYEFFTSKGKKNLEIFVNYLFFSVIVITLFVIPYGIMGENNCLVFSSSTESCMESNFGDHFYFSFGNYYLSSFGDIIPLGYSRIFYYIQIVFSVSLHTFFVSKWFRVNPKT